MFNYKINKRMIFKFLSIVLISLILQSCSTQTKSTALGGTLGAGMGAAIGGVIDPNASGKYRTRNIIIGSAVGGIAGAFAGHTLFEKNEKQKNDAYNEGQNNAKAEIAKSGKMPGLKEAKIESHWIEGRVVGNRYIDGHFEYVIIEPARWDVE